MNVTDLLTEAGHQFQMKERDNAYVECPVCHKENLSINIFTGVGHCWTGDCEYKGDFDKFSKDLSLRSADFTPSEAPVRDKTLTEEDTLAILGSVNNVAEIIEFAAKRRLDSKYLIKIGVGYDAKARALVIPFRDQSGALIGAKYRGDNGTQWIKGEEPLLYVLDPSDLKKDKIVIVEGEIDAITLRQFGIPTVGTLGAGKTKGLHLLNGIRQVLLGYDMDSAGNTGVEKAVAEIGRYRCKRVHWTSKDPNDMLTSGSNKSDIIDVLKGATSLATNLKSKTAQEAMDDFLTQQEKNPHKRLSWGYPRLDAFTKGIGGGMFIGVLAEAGTGKTTFIINAATNNSIAGTNVGICSLEEHPINELTPKLAATLIGRNPGTGGFAPEELELIKPQMKRVQLYEGDESVDSIIDWCRECYYVHDCKAVFIDYLQLMIPDEKDVQQLKEICYKFKKLVKELSELCIVMIIQPKQRQKQSDKQGKEIRNKLDGSDARGGAAINQSVDAMLTIRIVEGHPNVTQFEYTKVRGHLRVSKKDWLNQYTQLEYDHSTLRQIEMNQLLGGY